MKHDIFVCLPSARGVHPETMWNVFNMRTECERVGYSLSGGSLYRMPLDLARNELATIFLSTTCDVALLLDDDVQLEDPSWLPKMVAGLDVGLDAGCDVISAPCRMRSEGHLFNVVPTSAPFEIAGLRVVECAWSGLGAVVVHRRVFEKLLADACAADRYKSTVMPTRESLALFRSEVVPAREFFLEAPAELNLYMLDDRVLSMKLHEAGFKIHAAIDVPTVHDGLRGCFGEELEKIERSQAARRAPPLVDASGRAL